MAQVLLEEKTSCAVAKGPNAVLLALLEKGFMEKKIIFCFNARLLSGPCDWIDLFQLGQLEAGLARSMADVLAAWGCFVPTVLL